MITFFFLSLDYSEQQESNIFNRHSLRQWKKTNRLLSSSTSLSTTTTTLLDQQNYCYSLDKNHCKISNVDKQLEMVANLFNINNNQDNQNRFEDTDYLSVSKHFIPNANHKQMMNETIDQLIFVVCEINIT